MSRVAVPADRRFHRAHVKPARRRGHVRAFARPAMNGLAAALVAALAFYTGSAVIADTGVFRIDRVVVRGNERLSSADVLAVLSGLRGENLLWVDLEAMRGRLLASPWVREAALRRSLPSTVEVMVSERTPIGIGRMRGELYLIDERGVIIDQYGPLYADIDLPMIDGLDALEGGGPPAMDPHVELAARLMLALRARPQVARRVSQVDVSNPHNAAVILAGDPAVIHVGEDRFVSRLESYLELAAALRERVADIDYVDLRFDDRIYVGPVASRRR